jgi:hypothetical protein
MTAQGHRRPVTARDFNRLLFALLLLAALTVLARLVSRQESRAETDRPDRVTFTQWVQTADALFVRGEWDMAADAYFGALEAAAETGMRFDPRLQKKLALSLHRRGNEREGLHFMRLYAARLEHLARERMAADLALDDPFHDPAVLAEELATVRAQLESWRPMN